MNELEQAFCNCSLAKKSSSDLKDEWDRATNIQYTSYGGFCAYCVSEGVAVSAQVECSLSQRVDGKLHSWKFDGDDPYIGCVYCGEVRDAITGKLIQAGRSINISSLGAE